MDGNAYLALMTLISGMFLATGGLILSCVRWLDHRVVDKPTVGLGVLGTAMLIGGSVFLA